MLVTVSGRVETGKRVVTEVSDECVRWRARARAQPPPLQPVKVEPAAGAAVKVTAVPLANATEHVAPQEMPAGALVTVPVPAPLGVTLSAKGGTAKGAGTGVAPVSGTGQGPGPARPPPLHPP